MKKLLVMILLGALSFSAAEAQMTLSLDQAIEIALSDNPTIVVAGLEVERYDYVKKQTVSALYPKLDVSGQYSYALRKQEMAQGLAFGGKNTLNATASLSLPLFVPSVYRQMKLNDTQMALAVESARASRIDMIAAVRAAYYNVLLAEQSMEVLNEAIKTTEEVVENTKNLYDAGLAAEYDYITAQVQLSNLKPQVIQAQNGIDLTKRQLKMYLSIPEETQISVVGSLDDFRDEVLLGADYDVDLTNNTTMKTLELQSEMLEHQEKLIQTTRMPTIAAFGQISYIGQEPSTLGGLMGGMAGGAGAASDKKLWWQYPITLGAQISIPIFSGFSKTNQLREVRNQQAQLEIQREYTERGIMLQVQASVNNLLSARETMMANELTVEQAQKAYDISLSRYNAGAGTILELNSSQLTLTQAQLNYSQSIYDYLSAHAEYEKALGVDYAAEGEEDAE
ncbi:MAG: TolC family protein [Alistipes sp.]|jgi:outer membrane protein TolC|nr:TolC family protein [Alistipes sp.]